MKIRHYLYWTKNLVNMLWWKLLILLGVRRSVLPIPNGMYCYAPDDEKNYTKDDSLNNNGGSYYIKPCKYYKTLGYRYNGCSYLGMITDDMVFGDQCKMCSENYGDEDE